MLCTLKGIIIKVFFKGVINKISFEVFSLNPWNITIKFSLNGLSIKFPLKYFLSIFGITPISKDQMWLLACCNFQKTRSGSQHAGTFKRPEVAHRLLALSTDQMWLLA